MASKQYCRHCRRNVLAVWSYAAVNSGLILLVLLSCGMLFPLLLLLSPRSRYVCPRCLEAI